MKFERHMSDSEALMWNVEKDPWLNPSGATVVVLDRPIDIEEFRHRLRWAVAQTPRMRERVAPSFGRLSPPTWVPDPEFDFDFHVRHIALPAPGSLSQLYDLAARLHEDPFDRTRPLWTFVVIDGLDGGRGAMFLRIHHTLSDGLGLVQLAELYMDRKRDAPLPPEVDLEAMIAADLAAMGGVPDEPSTDAPPSSSDAGESAAPGGGKGIIAGLGGDLGSSVLGAASSSVGHLLRRQAGVARRIAGEVALWSADPTRARESVSGVVDTARSTISRETSHEIQIQASYLRRGVSLKIFGLDLQNDLEFTFNAQVRKNLRAQYDVLDYKGPGGSVVNGTTQIIIEPRARYTISNRVTASAFFRYEGNFSEGAANPGFSTTQVGLDSDFPFPGAGSVERP